MILGINHVSMSVPDLEQAIHFYSDLLGFKKLEQMGWAQGSKMGITADKITGATGTAGTAIHLRGPNLLIELFQFSGGNPKAQDPERPVIDHGITHFCLSVQNLDHEYARLKAAGVKFIGEPVQIAPGLRTVYGRDPFGNIIEFEEAKGRIDPAQSALSAVKDRVFTLGLAGVFALLFLALLLWQTPWLWNSPLSAEDIDGYAAALQEHVVMPDAEKAIFIQRMRDWAAKDDGRPVLMVNLMRYRDQLGELPAGMSFDGTPGEANQYYEKIVAPLALKRGEYPLIGGDAQSTSLLNSSVDKVDWDRVVIMRAPSRRAFIEFMADPAYGPAVPYKFAAEDVVLIPIDAQMAIQDLRWVFGGLLLSLFFLIMWRRTVGKLKRACGQ